MTRQHTLVRAYILHTRPYRETSLLMDLFTDSHGRISVVAKGAKKQRGVSYQLFCPVKASWSGQGELFTLTRLEPEVSAVFLPSQAYLSGFYANELLLKLCHRHAPVPEIFNCYEILLTALAKNALDEVALRLFERDLLHLLGYSLELCKALDTHLPIHAEQTYHYELEHGPVTRSFSQNSLTVSGATLLALAQGEFDLQTLKESKKLLRFALSHLLGEKPLKTRTVFRDCLALI